MAISFVSLEEQARFKEIEDFLEKSIYKIPMPEEIGEAPLYEPEKRREKNGGRNNKRRKPFRKNVKKK